jgi:hypothetical protein
VNPAQPPRRGVYFLANDGIYDLAIAFLNSFRKHNPDLALCLIPFDGNDRRIRALRDSYSFTVFDDAGVLHRCDRIAQAFHGRVVGHYRKLAVWEGPFQEFVYLDTDTVVLRTLKFVFVMLAAHAFIAPHSEIVSHRQWVWKDSIFSAGKLTQPQIEFAANTGFIASRKDALSLQEAEAKLPEALELAPHMELLCSEQPLLNFLMVTSHHPRTSLLKLGALGPVPQVYQAGQPVQPNAAVIHWAGLWAPSQREKRIRRILERFLLFRNQPKVRFFMPQKNLWTSYRRMRAKV